MNRFGSRQSLPARGRHDRWVGAVCKQCAVNREHSMEQLREEAALFGSSDRTCASFATLSGVQLISRDDELRLSSIAIRSQGRRRSSRRCQEAPPQDWRERDDVGHAIVGAVESAARAQLRRDRLLMQRPCGQAKTGGTEAYIEAMRSHRLDVLLGPAGTRSDYLRCSPPRKPSQARRARRTSVPNPGLGRRKARLLPVDLQAKSPRPAPPVRTPCTT